MPLPLWIRIFIGIVLFVAAVGVTMLPANAFATLIMGDEWSGDNPKLIAFAISPLAAYFAWRVMKDDLDA